jgi:lipid-A-disaccharide synthase
MKYYIIAGEASGDLHGSNLIKELRRLDHTAKIRCWGGDLMQQAGGEVVKHYRDLAFMGFIEVVQNLPTIFKNLRTCKKDIATFQPDVLVLIDYPGFNIRIAEWARENGLRVVYYISPQVWAWKEGRVKTIKKVVDRMLVILPFEEEFYRQRDYKVEFVGHPLAEVIAEYKQRPPLPSLSEKPIIAVLPGSRKQEIAKKLPIMLSVVGKFPGYDFIVAQAPSLDESFYKPFLDQQSSIKTVKNATYELLRQSAAAMVTSGTATLETALFGVPEVVCYKGSAVSFAIAKRLVKIKYISLVNLIMDKEVVTELIQDELTTENLEKELRLLLFDEEKKRRIRKDYDHLEQLLHQDQSASSRAAQSIIALLQSTL